MGSQSSKKTQEQKDAEAAQAFSDCQDSFIEYLNNHNVHLIYLDKCIMVVENDTNKVVRAATKDMLADFFKAEGVKGELKNIKSIIISNMSNSSGMSYYPAFTEKKEYIEVEGNAGVKQWNTFCPNIYTRIWYKEGHNFKADKEPFMFPTIEEYFDLFFEKPKPEEEDKIEEKDKPDAKRWFLHRIAAAMRFPDKRLPTSLILHGVEGSGKDTLRIILERLLGEQHVAAINGKAVQSNFNSYIPEKVIIFANEVFNWEKRADVENVMKDFVTNDRINVNKKYVPEYSVKNYAFWIFATNHPEFTPFDEGDRRYSYFTQSESLITKYQKAYNISENEARKKHIRPLIDFIKDYENAGIEDEFFNFYCWLMNLEIDWDLISKPLWTEDKEGAIRAKFGRNVYYVYLKKVLLEFQKKKKIEDVVGHKYVSHKELFDAFNAELPFDKKFETSHKFTAKTISMQVLGKPAMKTIKKETTYWTEIISPILIKDIFPAPSPENKPKKEPEYEEGTLKEKKADVIIPELDDEKDKYRGNPDYD
jgi:hypothetical protein